MRRRGMGWAFAGTFSSGLARQRRFVVPLTRQRIAVLCAQSSIASRSLFIDKFVDVDSHDGGCYLTNIKNLDLDGISNLCRGRVSEALRLLSDGTASEKACAPAVLQNVSPQVVNELLHEGLIAMTAVLRAEANDTAVLGASKDVRASIAAEWGRHVGTMEQVIEAVEQLNESRGFVMPSQTTTELEEFRDICKFALGL